MDSSKTHSPLAGESKRTNDSEVRLGEGEQKTHRFYDSKIKNLAKSMRSDQTDAEKKIWEIVRAKRLGYKFKRQHSVDNKYIADFICLEKRLIIEIDGSQHADNKKDKIRTAYLEKQGFKEIRFWNNEVLNNIHGCYQVILKELDD